MPARPAGATGRIKRCASNADELLEVLEDATSAPVVVPGAEDEGRLARDGDLELARGGLREGAALALARSASIAA